ncbi:hypothetical protein Bca52824_032408 [Brassica carinata]|uniref:Uncharacterized protein n=1 Tax=Brassica carinata TaxID=52824 RepID=A0A8X7SCG6_BRACI|nr:hypothetical protein Bca52824_032408 [Brassica carinata]
MIHQTSISVQPLKASAAAKDRCSPTLCTHIRPKLTENPPEEVKDTSEPMDIERESRENPKEKERRWRLPPSVETEDVEYDEDFGKKEIEYSFIPEMKCPPICFPPIHSNKMHSSAYKDETSLNQIEIIQRKSSTPASTHRRYHGFKDRDDWPAPAINLCPRSYYTFQYMEEFNENHKEEPAIDHQVLIRDGSISRNHATRIVGQPRQHRSIRDPEGNARAMDGRILQVSKEDIMNILAMANGPTTCSSSNMAIRVSENKSGADYAIAIKSLTSNTPIN